MAERAALVTGGSSGIGLAVARLLGQEGYAITLSARRDAKLQEAAEGLRAEGLEVNAVVAQMAEEGDVVNLVAAHRGQFGRLDVLVNSAGIGIGQPMDSIQTRHLDIQLGVNLRGLIIATRESLPMLREAGAEHGKALIVNMASIAGKSGEGWLSVYSATKAGVIAFSQATQKEVGDSGIQVTALAPGFVDTPMTDFVKESVGAEQMIRPQDIAEAVRMLLRTSRNCVIPEIVFLRPGDLSSP